MIEIPGDPDPDALETVRFYVKFWNFRFSRSKGSGRVLRILSFKHFEQENGIGNLSRQRPRSVLGVGNGDQSLSADASHIRFESNHSIPACRTEDRTIGLCSDGRSTETCRNRNR